MGGTNEQKISGLRVHVNNDNIHVHDDSRGLKYEGSKKQFKEDLKNAFDSLKRAEGIVKISGKREDLCIMKQGKVYSMFLADKRSIKTSMDTFLRTI